MVVLNHIYTGILHTEVVLEPYLHRYSSYCDSVSTIDSKETESEEVETTRQLSVQKFILPPGLADCSKADTIDSALKTLLIDQGFHQQSPVSLTWIKTKTILLSCIHWSNMH